MKKIILIRIFVFLAVMVVLAGCAAQQDVPTGTESGSSEPQEEKLLVFGDISDDPAEVIEGAQPLADYLAAHLSEFGYTGSQIKVASSIDEMAELIANGEIDIYFDSIYPATLVSDRSGAQIVMRRWRFGVEEYQSVIFASKSSGVTSLEDLEGQMVAMDAPYSTSGFMLPSVTLIESGLDLVGKSSQGAPVGEDEVGFVFSFDDENTLQWVLSGLVSAGVTDDYNFDVAFPASAKAELVELARTEAVPRQVMVAGSHMDAEVLDTITAVLLQIHEVPEAADELIAFQTTQFDFFPEGIEAATERMREMREIVQGIRLP